MKDFVKKFISAAMALALTASMSVYAEETTPVENVDGSVSAVIIGDAVNGVIGCGNHVTFRTDEYVYLSTTEKCSVSPVCTKRTDYYGYDLICMKCHEKVSFVKTQMAITHSVTHS